MLQDLSIQCPVCRETTTIAVSDDRDGGIASTACRHCRHPFLAVTEDDGRILLVDGNPGEADSDPRILAVLQPATGKSGYRVEPPEHLGIFDRGLPPEEPGPGLSDEELHSGRILALGNALRKPDGSRRDPKEVAKVFGWRAVWLEQLNEALRIRLAGPPPLTFPPRIFISYRWGTPAENQWTADLARNLKERGYPVIFDRDEPQESVNVPEIVSKIADCRYFLAILDAGYIERIGRGGSDKILDGWVYDEYNTAASLSNHRQLRIVGLLRSGNALPNSFEHPVPGMRGNTVDVRSPEQLALVLDDLFPPIENGPDEAEVERARVRLRESHEHLCARRFQEAFRSAEALTELLPGVIDGPAQKVRVAFQAGWVAEGLAAAEEALALAPNSRELLLAAGSFANDAGQPVRAVAHFGLFLELHGQSVEPDVAAAHHGLGSCLDDLDQLYPAIAHLELARRRQPASADVAGTLGYVYLRAGEATTAIERLEEGLIHDPENVTVLLNLALALCYGGRAADARDKIEKLASIAPGHPQLPQLRALIAHPQKMPSAAPSIRARCEACSARVPVTEDDDVLCGRCGSIRSKDEHDCPYCGSDGRVFLIPGIPFGCPYCREGPLSIE